MFKGFLDSGQHRHAAGVLGVAHPGGAGCDPTAHGGGRPFRRGVESCGEFVGRNATEELRIGIAAAALFRQDIAKEQPHSTTSRCTAS
ncbi:MAG TPA: hypothetical protein VNS34_04360 [Rhizobiaceae bacterium]|nr:hypothetical protein [Rhizobiaceae bacterium]